MSMSFDIVSTAAAPASPSARGTASFSICTPLGSISKTFAGGRSSSTGAPRTLAGTARIMTTANARLQPVLRIIGMRTTS